MKTLRFFLLIFLLTNSSLQAADKEYVSFDLASSHNHPVTKRLRESFDVLFKKYSANEISFDRLKLGKRQIEMLKEKFVVLVVSEGEFGGYFLTIVISLKEAPYKFYSWRVWLYDISGNGEEFEIRNIKETAIGKKEEEQFLPLLNKENLKYWQ